jgi:hypothetical protein
MTELTLHGCGVAFQTRVGVEKELAEGRLIFLPIRDPHLRRRKLMLMTRARARLSGAGISQKSDRREPRRAPLMLP